MSESTSLPRRAVGEWSLHSGRAYAEPFIHVWVEASLTAPSGQVYTLPGFYDGENTWRVRFSPGEVGRWRYHITSHPADDGLTQIGEFEVTERATSGFLRATPDRAWGFSYESGAPVFLMGDTVYHLFGAAYCGMDVRPFLQRRAAQGFNILRVRVPVSPFHPPDGYSRWQTLSTWPWGGSPQSPQFERFNLAYFHVVDEVVQQAAALGIGFEMIMEAWGFEFPFNNRAIFLPEWEELWLRYLIARYDAFASVYIWTLLNEYEFYPDGNCREKYVADRWAMRTARWVKATAPHGHVIAVHNGPKETPFRQRFALDPQAIDVIMFQEWGSCGEQDGWLAAGIENKTAHALREWSGAAVLAEYAYERNPDLPITFPGFEHTGVAHNRRGAWRGAFCGLGIISGLENTWGPVMDLVHDQEGVACLKHLHHFFTAIVPFDRLRPAPDLICPQNVAEGYRARALAAADRRLIAVYFPAGGAATLIWDQDTASVSGQWYNPRTGALDTARPAACTAAGIVFVAPDELDAQGHPTDWVLVLTGNFDQESATGFNPSGLRG